MRNRKLRESVPAIVAAVVIMLWLAASSHRAAAQSNHDTDVIDLNAQRQPITSIATNWRFHPGDDPSWSEPGFDDSSWKIIQPTRGWDAQGYSEHNSFAWFRFRLLVPAGMRSVVVQIPRLEKNYQFFAQGRLIGQTGSWPPTPSSNILGAARLYTVRLEPGSGPQQITLALRLWQEPRLVGITQNALHGRALAGDPATVMREFATAKAASLLSRAGDYTRDIIVLIIGAATLLLFLLTRQGFYLWFTLNMLLSACVLPTQLLSWHFGWNYLWSLYGYILLDFLSNVSLAFFLLGALNIRRPRIWLLVSTLSLLGELGPLLLVAASLPLLWADGLYFVFDTAPELLLIWFLVRGWRAGSIDAKLLFFPYTLAVALNALGNLGHFLVDLNVPHADAIVTGRVLLLSQPFEISLEDVANILSLLGLLAVLVYRFARTSREQQRLASALQAAHDIQQRLVPVNIPSLGGLHTEVVYLAAEEVGGDFCQILPRPDGSILVAIGDVSGKGLQAAMLGTLAVGALRSMAEDDVEPVDMLDRLNQVILRTASEGFITCLCLKLSPEGVVTLANAGHLAPYLNGEEIAVDAGLPLGIVSGVDYSQSTLVLPAAARLTLLSDGVVEARSRTGELFGFERTSEISQLPASEIAGTAQRFGQEDDITIITLDWRLPVAELIPA
jgi:hypothetical protein